MSTEAPQNPGSHKMKSFRLFRRKRRAQEEVSASDTNTPGTSVIAPPKKRPSLLARFVTGCSKIVFFVACLGALQFFVYALTQDSAKKLDETAQKIAARTSNELAKFEEMLTVNAATLASLEKDVVNAFSSPEWGYIAALVRGDEDSSEVRRNLASQAEKAVSLARSYLLKEDIDSAGQCYLNALNLLYGDMEIIADMEARFRKLAETQAQSGEMTEAQTTLFALNELLKPQLSRVDPSDLEKLLASSAATIEEVQRIGETQHATMLNEAGNPYVFKDAEEVRSARAQSSENPSAEAYADILERIQLSDFPKAELEEVEELALELVPTLRQQVKAELNALYRDAAEAPNFGEASRHLTEAAGVLALYPMSEEEEIIQEVESLSERHKDVQFRIESIRKARYNVWAAKCIQESLKTLRAEENDYRIQSLIRLATVEPSFLEASTSALYAYAIEQIMEEYKAAEKATVAIVLNDPSVRRKSLGDF